MLDSETVMFEDFYRTENCMEHSIVKFKETEEVRKGIIGFYKQALFRAFKFGRNSVKHKDVYEKEISNLNATINFLKKELIKKSFCRQVMKRQYRELRQKYDAVKPRVEVQVELKEHRFAYFDITNWSKEEAEELLKKWKEIERRNK